MDRRTETRGKLRKRGDQTDNRRILLLLLRPRGYNVRMQVVDEETNKKKMMKNKKKKRIQQNEQSRW